MPALLSEIAITASNDNTEAIITHYSHCNRFQCRKCRGIKELNMSTSCSCAGEFRTLSPRDGLRQVRNNELINMAEQIMILNLNG